jgi:predicted 2-oxoglutarate/Fe(II)-dependent dioxygenase YbiX
MKELKDYIVVINNIMPLPVADAVLSEYKNCDDWVQAIVGSGKEALDTRNCKTIGLSFSGVIEKNLAVRQKIDQDLFSCAAQAIQHYKDKVPLCTIQEDSGYELLKYGIGQFYKEHIDSFKDRPRAVSCSFMLNDDYEGGEFSFFDRELVYNLKKGSCIMFPSNFMYPHEVMPVTSGTRYSIVTWFV